MQWKHFLNHQMLYKHCSAYCSGQSLFPGGEEPQPQMSVLLKSLPSHKNFYGKIISTKKPKKISKLGILQREGQCGWTLKIRQREEKISAKGWGQNKYRIEGQGRHLECIRLDLGKHQEVESRGILWHNLDVRGYLWGLWEGTGECQD